MYRIVCPSQTQTHLHSFAIIYRVTIAFPPGVFGCNMTIAFLRQYDLVRSKEHSVPLLVRLEA